jgi:UDP-N-acetylglucosamine pyrophosphorylase
MQRSLAVIIMAAGKGTRMNNPDIAKVMYTINGRPLVEYVVDLALQLSPARIVVVVGWQKDSVIEHLKKRRKPVFFAEQTPQLGTGHAVMQAEPQLSVFVGDVLVLSGDVPLLSYETMIKLIDVHRKGNSIATVLTADLDEPSGYGRIVRNAEGDVIGIVEHRDASAEQRLLREINSGIYVFDVDHLFLGLKHISPSNTQKEYYLTDVFEYFWRNNFRVGAMKTIDSREILGVNTPGQLEEASALLAGRPI